jgi:bifunctional non-homologous end joining protein LigD
MNQHQSLQSVSLYYREGSSDKVYHVQIAEASGGYAVNFQYGRRGSSLQSGTKTPQPVTLGQAEKAYAKLVAEKKGKGYTEGEAGTPYSGAETAGRVSGLQPQLLNAIDEERVQSLLDDPAFIMQEKKDGNRLMVRRSQHEIAGSNRKGLEIPIAVTIEAGVKELTNGVTAVLDGEAVGDIYYVFDLLEIDGEDLRTQGYEHRWCRFDFLFSSREGGIVRLLPISRKIWHKRQRIGELQAAGAEGVVFKRWDAPYIPGCPASGEDQLKFKFVQTATCSVAAVNSLKRSIKIQVEDPRTHAALDIGNVTIPPNSPVPRPGELVEVRYLYAFPGGSLYQPVYLGRRDDKDGMDSLDSLKFKAESAG